VVAVSTIGVQAPLRVLAWVSKRLDLNVYEVDDEGAVHPGSCRELGLGPLGEWSQTGIGGPFRSLHS
jgi:hypothetical protein